MNGGAKVGVGQGVTQQVFKHHLQHAAVGLHHAGSRRVKLNARFAQQLQRVGAQRNRVHRAPVELDGTLIDPVFEQKLLGDADDARHGSADALQPKLCFFIAQGQQQPQRLRCAGDDGGGGAQLMGNHGHQARLHFAVTLFHVQALLQQMEPLLCRTLRQAPPQHRNGQQQRKHQATCCEPSGIDGWWYVDDHVLVEYAFALLRCDGADAFVQYGQQHGLVKPHAHAQLVVKTWQAARNLEHEQPLLADGVGRDSQGANGHVCLAVGHCCHDLVLCFGEDDFQIWVLAGNVFGHRGAFGQCNGLPMQRTQVSHKVVVFASDDDVGFGQQRRGKRRPLLPLGCFIQKTQHLAPPLAGGFHALGPAGGGHQLQGQAHAAGHQLEQIGRNAYVLALLVDVLERHPVWVDTVSDRGVLLHPSLFGI